MQIYLYNSCFLCNFAPKLKEHPMLLAVSSITEFISNFFGTIRWSDAFAAFFLLIAIIDPIGNMPMVIQVRDKGGKIHPTRVCIFSLLIFLVFLMLGDLLLTIFQLEIEYFAIAGGAVIMLLSLEMILDITIFQTTELGNESSDLIPLAFPMFAGPGAFTAMLSMHAKFSILSLLMSVLMCIIVLYIVLRGTNWLTEHLGPVSMYIVRKFFGVIAFAISIQLIVGNLVTVFA